MHERRLSAAHLQVQDQHLEEVDLPFEEHLEKSAEDLASGSQGEAHTVLVAGAVVGFVGEPRTAQTGREGQHVRSRRVQVVVPLVGVHMDQEEASVLGRVHEQGEGRIDWV